MLDFKTDCETYRADYGMCTEYKLYWSLMTGDEITKIIDPALEKILDEEEWTQIGYRHTIDGICKLSLYYAEDESKEDACNENEINEDASHEDVSKKQLRTIKQDTRKAQVLEITHEGELLSAKEIKPHENESPLIQEEILLNYDGELTFVQVVQNEEASYRLASFIKESYDCSNTLTISSNRRIKSYSWAFVSTKVFWVFEEEEE